MAIEARVAENENPYAAAESEFAGLIAQLGSTEMSGLTHSEVEAHIETRGCEALRLLFEGYLVSRGPGRVAEPVVGVDGHERSHERERGRNLSSMFGPVRFERCGYRGHELESLYPLDGSLNLPLGSYTYGVRKHVALEVAKSSYDESLLTLDRLTGAHVPKRQAEELVRGAGVDFDAFYEQSSAFEDESPLLVLTVDGKGVVMRTEHLRPATRRAAEAAPSEGGTAGQPKQKRAHRKRMATVAAVYGIEPHVRQPERVIAELRRTLRPVSSERPRPQNKRVWASVKKDSFEVIDELLQEAKRRDPEGRKRWVALVDGQENQLAVLRTFIDRDDAEVTIVLDLMHVAGYLWEAGSAFHKSGTDEAANWVYERLLRVLRGKSSHVAAGMRRSATRRGLDAKARKAVDVCANYLLKNTPYLRYDEYLADGLPIATGVIEGTCRSLINDRLDITGARWSVDGAEAVLRLRALMRSGDFNDYWEYHEKQEHRRNHVERYRTGIPATATQRSPSHQNLHLVT